MNEGVPFTPTKARLPMPDARVLRSEKFGMVAGKRPEVPLTKGELRIKEPQLQDLPKGPVDVAIIFGMGPVDPVMKGADGKREPRIGKARARHNTVAGLELAARGYIKKDGMVVLSGTATADPMEVEAAVQRKQANIADRDTFLQTLGTEAQTLEPAKLEQRWQEYKASVEISTAQDPTPEEAEQVYTTSEAEVMESLFRRAKSKVVETDANGVERQVGIEDLHLNVWSDHLATETTDNYIDVLNQLDDDSLAKGGGLFDGTIAAITSRYHIARTIEIARMLGLEGKVVPLVSQEVLKSCGYKDPYANNPKAEQFDKGTRWGEQRWIRAIYQMPEYLLPALGKIKNEQRLINTLQHVQTVYGRDVMQKFGLGNLTVENAPQIREALKAIIRHNPLTEDWLKTDTREVNTAIDQYVNVTQEWLKQEGGGKIHER